MLCFRMGNLGFGGLILILGWTELDCFFLENCDLGGSILDIPN